MPFHRKSHYEKNFYFFLSLKITIFHEKVHCTHDPSVRIRSLDVQSHKERD